MMDFAALPPEINSARMYTGPGAQPLLEAAAGWQATATSLQSTASGIADVVSGLGNVWSGPSFTALTTSVSRYVTWLTTTAGQASATASQALASVGAFEVAFAATIPPPVVAANRSLLAALVSTNFLGVNTPAIMATEAHYVEMWAQDVAAMVGYQAGIPVLNSFVPAAPIARIERAVQQALGPNVPTNLWDLLNSTFVGVTLPNLAGQLVGLPNATTASGWAGLASLYPAFNPNSTGGSGAANSIVGPVLGGVSPTVSGGGSLAGPVTVSLASAPKVGALSVPQSWPVQETAAVTPLEGSPMMMVPPLLSGNTNNSLQRIRYGMPIKFMPQQVGS